MLETRIYVYNFADLGLIDAIDTCSNPKGICAMNNDSDNCVLANPGITIGTVRVSIYSPEDRNYVLKVSD